tara:strand:+ start:843 stop:1118 length:276 start_codon:yes stop_codon:yes gene_type:complete
MAYKLNIKWFSKNGCEEVVLSKTRVDFCYKNTKSLVSGNQELLKELYDMGKPYVSSDEEKKITKKKKVNGIKETAGKKEEKQVSTKASEEK